MFFDIIGGIILLIVLVFIIGSIYFHNKDRAIEVAKFNALVAEEQALEAKRQAQILKEEAEIRQLLIQYLSK